jgi:hypothetical protein
LEKSKKDVLSKKANCETSSLDEYTALTLFEENNTIQECSELIVLHFDNLG